MRYVVLGGAALVLLFTTTACSVGDAQPGPEINRSFDVADFTSIEVAGSYDVVVTTGKPVSVTARGTQRLVASIRTEVRDGKLFIRPDTPGWQRGWDNGRTWARISISMPALEAAGVTGSGGMSVDKVAGSRFSGSVSGSGDLALGKIKVEDVELVLAGSGGVTAAGQVRKASYSITGSGDLDASALTAREAAASVAGSGSIRARVTGSANANVMGSGDIAITGGARCQTSKNGSGNIRCS